MDVFSTSFLFNRTPPTHLEDLGCWKGFAKPEERIIQKPKYTISQDCAISHMNPRHPSMFGGGPHPHWAVLCVGEWHVEAFGDNFCCVSRKETVTWLFVDSKTTWLTPYYACYNLAVCCNMHSMVSGFRYLAVVVRETLGHLRDLPA